MAKQTTETKPTDVVVVKNPVTNDFHYCQRHQYDAAVAGNPDYDWELAHECANEAEAANFIADEKEALRVEAEKAKKAEAKKK